MNNNRKDVCIIRSAIGSPSSIGFLKFLREQRFKVIGTDVLELVAGKYFVDKFYTIPRADREDDVISAYLDVAKNEKANWIISGPESEITVLAKHNDEFARRNIGIFHPPATTLQQLTDKWCAFLVLKDSVKIASTQQLDRVKIDVMGDDRKYILKPRLGRGSKGIRIVKATELHDYLRLIDPREYILQDFIEGEEITVDLLFDMHGTLLNAVPRKRLVVDSGISLVTETFRDDHLFDIIKILANKFIFVGGNCFQFIRNDKSEYFLTDINPRFGGGSILSLRASQSFRSNLTDVLSFKTLKNSSRSVFDFRFLRMYRGYFEIYED